MFNNIYKNKKVLVTGHTGFKGTWLTTWLIKLGANVIGISKDIPTHPSMFKELKLEEKIKHYQEDIRDLSKMTVIILNEKPDFLFHLAAQPIVSTSYSDPIETISSNVMGTANILEALKTSNHKCTAIIITSDKAYDNVEQVWGYKEDDKMGGKDVYSGSKGAAELIIKSYYHSFLKNKDSNIKLAIGRAGNVIGGGDWAKDRLMTDIILSVAQNKKVNIRNPYATRPWQHVLEPLSGYLLVGQKLLEQKIKFAEGWNFGPNDEGSITVEEVVINVKKNWDIIEYEINRDINQLHEANLLKLDCSKAHISLKWQNVWDSDTTFEKTIEWYKNFYENQSITTQEDLQSYVQAAREKGIQWAN